MKKLVLALVVLASLAACREKVRVRVTHRTADAGTTTSTTPAR